LSVVDARLGWPVTNACASLTLKVRDPSASRIGPFWSREIFLKLGGSAGQSVENGALPVCRVTCVASYGSSC
jgi:hypothetical protein